MSHQSRSGAKRRKIAVGDDPLLRAFLNQYAGCAVPDHGNPPQIDRVRYASLDADAFETKYVLGRRPVILTDALSDESDLAGANMWTNAFLRDACGGDASTSRVESRDEGANERFGRGKYKSMTFDAFMDKYEARDGGWYLSAGGKAEPFAAPGRLLASETAKSSKGKLPLRPKGVPRSLVPADVNLWMGRNSTSTSSGLHHDYHDNLYVLVRGEKTFKVFSPRDAGRMYTTGKICWVHENGLINYKGASTLQDGDVALATGESALEFRLRKARGDEDEDEPAIGSSDDDFADFDGVDDYDELNQTPEPSDDDSAEEEKRKDDDDEEDPPSFSRIDYDRLDEFPLFKTASAMEFTVKAGEALYLPTGWFHDVSSRDAGEGHVAFNYWFHPPPLGEACEGRRALWEEDFQRSVLPKFQ